VLGHSFLVKYKRRGGKGEEATYAGAMQEAAILFTRHNIGRKRAR